MSGVKGTVFGVLLVSVLAAAVGAVPLATEPAAWKGLTPDQVNRVKAGEIVILDRDTSQGGAQTRFIQAALLFNQPLETTYKLFKQTERQDRYLPDLKSCKLVSRDQKGDRVDFHIELFGVSIDYRIHHVYDDANYTLTWGLDPNYDNDMKRVDGFWRLYQYDAKRTLARYGTNVEVSSLIPDAIMARLTRTNLPANMEAVKKYIDSGGTYVKPGYKGK